MQGATGPLTASDLPAYQCAEERGHPEAAFFRAAFNLGNLLLRRGETEAAMAAYRRAEARGDPGASVNIGPPTQERGELDAAEAAYARAEARGVAGTCSENGGDLDGADRAWHLAEQLDHHK